MTIRNYVALVAGAAVLAAIRARWGPIPVIAAAGLWGLVVTAFGDRLESLGRG